MKKLIFFVCTVCFAVACNNKDEKTGSNGSDSPKNNAKMDYPYTLDSPYKDWQPGDQQHAVNVMKSLKAWQDNKIAEAVSYFGDSVEIRFDNYHKTLPHDSLTKEFSGMRDEYSNVTIKMEDWESVISKDKKDEWVTMWYKQITTNKNGKTDSVEVVDDAKIVKGKIVLLDEKIQHFPAKQK